MKNLYKYILIFLVSGFLAYQLTITFLPNIIYKIFYSKVMERDRQEVNKVNHIALPTDDSKFVVMPNPDFLYATAFYDLSEGPLRLTGNMPDSTYWSIAFYQPNTVNWFVKNDIEFETSTLDLILKEKGTELTVTRSSDIAESPVKKGLMLIRILVTDNSPEVVERYQNWQKTIQFQKL
ncbi:MAG: DUF1254 domain-containing protein [Bacteroidetes bacterium]|jgi:uncharacterized membrane protein|nr:DUF1254 domain-containing protein [Bacteroidota bacterium]